ncbi:hypothetical protein SAMN04490244_101595 [Tranquillimonas rosea]|uniref:PH domain-containing protein n=1 Tax=Tranquillimonas rosea TaxID=641238 RepID=A0A1H9QE69_9RHOB|nr:hypothetical protein [Tranquillimonas rosea]SER58841.1 hypothetical protein SAMN04490244_101595 [Tranquillimonas rosea]
MSETQEVLAELRPGAVRRVVGTGLLAATGALLLYSGSTSGNVLLLPIGGALLVLSGWFWRATASRLVLTAEGLRDETGRVLAPIDNIASVDRGAFAFKPSNGFVLRLARPMPAAWAPGLWWRVGQRLGVGGVVPAAQTKAMSERVAELKLERAAET